MVDLVLRERLEAADPPSASVALRSVIGEGEVTASAPALRWVQTSLVDDGITVTRITSSGADVRAATPGSPDLVAFLVRSGALRILRGGETHPLEEGGIGLLPMGERVELTWDEVEIDLFALPPSSVARLIGTEGRAIRLHAPSVVPKDPTLAEYWRRLASGLTLQMLTQPDLYERDLLRSQLVDALAAVTIEAFALSDRSEEDLSGDGEALQRAVVYMEAHLGDPISVSQIAAATGISVRGLQLLFQRQLASTPVAHLRRLRMIGARAALGSPSRGTTVGAVGRRFGYTNLGRFSAHFRAEFGEAPSRTLQQATGTDPRSA